MSAERVCAQSGLLVDGDTRVLTDPCEYYHPAVGVQVGCGRLRCESCKAWVRSGPPGLGLKAGTRFDLRALHAAPDWSALAFVEQAYTLFNRMRLHACLCCIWTAESVAPIDNDHELVSDPAMPWACAGHPAPEPPLVLNQLVIDAGTDWTQLVDAILRGSCPRALERPEALGAEPGLWLAWLYVYLRGLPIADELSLAIADRIEDPEPQVVGRVLYFFVHFSRARGIEKIVAHIEADIHRVALGYPIPEHPPALTRWAVLETRLRNAPDQRDDLDARVEALVERLLVMPRSSLPHDDVGPSGTGDFERQRRERLGWDSATLKYVLDDFARTRARERTDVVGRALERSAGMFASAERRRFIADHILEIDAAAPGRWRQALALLSDWHGKPAQGHLIVVAGARVILARRATPAEFRAWIAERRRYGWVDAAWVAPLETMLEATERLEAALAEPGRKLQASGQEQGGKRGVTIYSLAGGGAKELLPMQVPAAEHDALVAMLTARGCDQAETEFLTRIVWVRKPDGVEVFDARRKQFDADGERATLEDGRVVERADIAQIFAWASDDHAHRGIQATLRSGEDVELVTEIALAATGDPTYNRNDLLMDSGWCTTLGRLIASWAGAPFEDRI